jgi:hypothetical protein
MEQPGRQMLVAPRESAATKFTMRLRLGFVLLLLLFLIDFTKQEITIIDSTHKLFSTVGAKDY